MIAEAKSPIQVILHRVSSRSSFLKRLKRIEQDFATSRSEPHRLAAGDEQERPEKLDAPAGMMI
jgi:hypothetical protein